tara:strand:- start:51 stop:605 length:555 start_codon:yes stop_codon:yes gene_type:complete
MSTLKVNNLQEADGSVFPYLRQVVSVSDTVRESTGSFSVSQSYVDTPFAVTITPASSSNKILVGAFFHGEGSTNEHEFQFAVERAISGGATTRLGAADVGNRAGTIAVPPQGYFSDNNDSTPFMMAFNGLLDSPATTSAITYTLQCRAATGSRTVYYNRNANDGDFNLSTERGVSWITVMEVVA